MKRSGVNKAAKCPIYSVPPSFYPRTIRDWNQLPTHITDIDDTEGFKAALDDLLRGGSFVFKAYFEQGHLNIFNCIY